MGALQEGLPRGELISRSRSAARAPVVRHPAARHAHPGSSAPRVPLPPVDSNHHSQIQSLVSCHWTRGQQQPIKLLLARVALNHLDGRHARRGTSQYDLLVWRDGE